LGRQDVVDPRDDIYSLGATLYELLTLRPIFAGQDRDALLRQISLLEPTAPRRVNRAVPGDLETIVLKAVAKARADRYATAGELADDLRRYLETKPIHARRPTIVQRLAKWSRRHRSLVAAVGVVLVMAVAALAASTVLIWREMARAEGALVEAQASRRRAEIEAERAGQEARRAEAATRFLQDALGSIDPASARGREVTVREVFDQVAKDVGTKFADEPLLEAAIRHTLGTTYLGMGSYDAAYQHLSIAAKLRQEHLGKEHRDTLASMDALANSLHSLGKPAEAEQLFREALEIRQRVLGKEDRLTLETMYNLGCFLFGLGRDAEAEQLHKQVLESRQRILGKAHEHTLMSMDRLTECLERQGKLAEAESVHRQKVDIRQRLRALSFHPRDLARDLANTQRAMSSLASCLEAQGKLPDAEQLREEIKRLDAWKEKEAEAHREEWREEMRRRAMALRAWKEPRDANVPLEVLPEPLLRYEHPERSILEASVWALGRAGRPAALLTMEFYPQSPGVASGWYEFISLSDGPLRAEPEGGDWKWEPNAPGVELRPLPGAPAPAASAAGRLEQTKALARRFGASEEYDGGFGITEETLALLDAPLYRYADEPTGLVDGAIFAFASGRKPELVLLIELRKVPGATAGWHYAPARLTGLRLSLSLDGQEVWNTLASKDMTYAISPTVTFQSRREPGGGAPATAPATAPSAPSSSSTAPTTRGAALGLSAVEGEPGRLVPGFLKEILVQAVVDHDSELWVTPEGLFWKSGVFAKPGLPGPARQNYPTWVNGRRWVPVWGKPEEPSGQDTTQPLALAVGPVDDLKFELLAVGTTRDDLGIESRSPVRTRREGKALVVLIPDHEPSARWYTFRLRRP
jgi:tetratricopeptide (TPR) repeat protein